MWSGKTVALLLGLVSLMNSLAWGFSFCDMVLSKYFICVNKSFIGVHLVACAGWIMVVHVCKQDVGLFCFACALSNGGNRCLVKATVLDNVQSLRAGHSLGSTVVSRKEL